MTEFQDDDDVEARRQLHAWRLLVAQNVATNGRWFCALLSIVNALHGQPVVAICAAVPIGLSVFVDLMKPNRYRTIASLIVYGLAIYFAIFSIAIHW